MSSPPLLQRLKERKLVQWALAYLAGAFVVVQVIDAVETPLRLSATIQRGILAVLVIGFLLTLVLAWFHGEKGRQRVSGPELLLVTTLLVVAGVALSMVVGSERDEASIPSATKTGTPSLAVLPPDVVGTEAEDAQFADGLAEAVHMRLIPVSGLSVKARYAADQYPTAGKRYQEIGEELGATYLLDLGVSKGEEPGGARLVRVTANLVRASDEETVWG